MKYKAKWVELIGTEDCSRQAPPQHTKLWLCCADGSIHRGQRIVDTYHGGDRIKWDNAGYMGFQDLAISHGEPSLIVTHWSLYFEPEKPLGPGYKKEWGTTR